MNQLLGMFTQSGFSDDDYDRNSNIAELLQEIFENSSTDLIGNDNISLIMSALLLPLSQAEVDSFLKLPTLISKLLSFSSKSKLPINFSSFSSELSRAASSIDQFLRQNLISAKKTGQHAYFYSVSKKTLQYFEVLESMVSTEDPTVYAVLSEHKTLEPIMVACDDKDFFEAYPWSNLIHDRIVGILAILANGSEETTSYQVFENLSAA